MVNTQSPLAGLAIASQPFVFDNQRPVEIPLSLRRKDTERVKPE
jgi:hypothetical protein